MRSGTETHARRQAWVWLAVALAAIKLWLALRLDLFGDEAFYRWESRHPALGYSDVPGLTAWLIRLGTELGGTGAFGARWPFLLLGALLPWLVYRLARLVSDRRDAGLAAALSLSLPLAALAGVLALPDVPLTCAMLASLYFLARLRKRDRWRDALALGLCLAAGWLGHYRFALIYLAGAAYLELSRGGHALRRSPRFWCAQAIGLLGLAPALAYNVMHAFSAVRFQFVERHPWSFHADGLGEVFVQAAVTTPLLFALLVVAAIGAWRAPRAAPGDSRAATVELYAIASVTLLGAYLVLDCFADATRLRLHWPLPAYLFALPLLPPLLRRWLAATGWRRWLALATPATAFVGVVLALAWMANAARPIAALDGAAGRYVPDHQTGWSELAAWAGGQRAALGPGTVPIAGDFMVGAEWAYALGDGDEPYVLDHPANHKHGRATQLETFRRDETALRGATWSQGLLIFDDTAFRPIEVVAMYRGLCPRFGSVEYRGELIQRGGRARFLAFRVTPGRDADKADRCRLPPLADLWAPGPAAKQPAGPLVVKGWAFAEFIGVEKVEIVLDGAVRGAATYGQPAPQVAAQWPQSRDPQHPNVGFAASVDTRGIDPGEHRFQVRVTDREGRARDLQTRWLEFEAR